MKRVLGGAQDALINANASIGSLVSANKLALSQAHRQPVCLGRDSEAASQMRWSDMRFGSAQKLRRISRRHRAVRGQGRQWSSSRRRLRSGSSIPLHVSD